MGAPPIYPWRDEYYVAAYRLSQAGTSREGIARALGIPIDTFKRWYRNNAALRDAINTPRVAPVKSDGGIAAVRAAAKPFNDYVAGRIPDHLQPIWDRLNNIFEFKPDQDTNANVEACLAGTGILERQHLFIYAVIHSNFSKSEAMRKVNINRETYYHWMKDREFRELYNFIVTEMKQDFFEGLLIRKAAAGDTAAIIFGNRTLNADRGYNPKMVVEHKGTVDVRHQDVDVDDISDLPIELQRQALELTEAISNYRATGKLPPKPVAALPPIPEDRHVGQTEPETPDDRGGNDPGHLPDDGVGLENRPPDQDVRDRREGDQPRLPRRKVRRAG